MRIGYTGKGGARNNRCRQAEITVSQTLSSNYDKELARLNLIASSLEADGWSVDSCVEGWLIIGVADKDEYMELVKDYKKAKKKINGDY